MWSKAFWKAAGERAVKTVAQALLVLAGITSADQVPSANVLDLDWPMILVTAGAMGVASLLFSVVSAGVGNSGPSLASEQLTAVTAYQPEHAVDVDDGDSDEAADEPTWSRDA